MTNQLQRSYVQAGWQKLCGLWQSKTFDVNTVFDKLTAALLNALLSLNIIKDVYPPPSVPKIFYSKSTSLNDYLLQKVATQTDDVYVVFHKSDCWLSDLILIVGGLCGVDIQPHRVHCSLWFNGVEQSVRTSMTWAGAEYDTTYDPCTDDTLTGIYHINVNDAALTYTEINAVVNTIESMGVRSTTFTFLRALFGVTTTNVCCTYVAALLGLKLDEPTPNNLLKKFTYGVVNAWEL